MSTLAKLAMRLSVCVLLVAASLTAAPAFAQDGDSPIPDQPVNVQEVTSSTELVGPGSKTTGPQLDAYLQQGSQSAALTAGIAYWTAIFPPYFFRGYARIDLGGAPTGQAWDTLSLDGGQLGTTAGNPCWTTTSCTSTVYNGTSPNGFGAHYGQTALSFAETNIYWSSGGQSYTNATVTHTF